MLDYFVACAGVVVECVDVLVSTGVVDVGCGTGSGVGCGVELVANHHQPKRTMTATIPTAHHTHVLSLLSIHER